MSNKKRSSRAKHILRPVRASITILYQTRAEISTICPRFVTIIIFFIYFCLRIWLTKKFLTFKSLPFFDGKRLSFYVVKVVR